MPADISDDAITKLQEEIIKLHAQLDQSRQALEDLHEQHQRTISEHQEFTANIFALADTIPALVFITRPDQDRFLYINQAAESITGFSHAELMNGRVSDIVHPDHRQMVNDYTMARVRGENPPGRYDVKIICRNHDARDMHIAARRMEIDGEAVIAGAGLDMSEQRMAEARLAQKQKMEALGMLAGGIAHDFNNILAIILSSAEQARALTPSGTELQYLLWEIIRVGLKGRNLIGKLFDFSSVDKRSHFHRVDVNQLVQDADSMLRPLAFNGVDIDSELFSGPLWVNGDRVELQQVIMNICLNANNAMEAGGGILNIRVGAAAISQGESSQEEHAAPGEYARISVQDSGTGMDAETRAQIFMPLFTTCPEKGHTGLGLAIAGAIVQRHGGFIRVFSEKGQGSRFDIYLPLADIRAARAAEEHKADRKSGAEHARILFVDNEPFLVRITSRILERLGYETIACSDAKSALEAFGENPGIYDLVITDYSVCEMPGTGFIEEIRKLRPGIPVIISTGNRIGLKNDGFSRQRIDMVLQKPVISSEYDRAIKQVLETRRNKGSDAGGMDLTGGGVPGHDDDNGQAAPLLDGAARRNEEPGESQPPDTAKRLQILEAVMTGMSHEIRQALSAIAMASSEALYWKERGVETETDEMLEDMANILRRCQRIDDMLGYSSRFAFRDPNPPQTSIDLNDTVGKVMKLISSRIMAHGLRFQYRLDPHPIMIWASRQLVEEGLILFSNAISRVADALEPGCISFCVSTVRDQEGQLKISIESALMGETEWARLSGAVAQLVDGSAEHIIVREVQELLIHLKFPAVPLPE